MAEDVAAFIQKHELQQPTLIGHSMYGHLLRLQVFMIPCPCPCPFCPSSLKAGDVDPSGFGRGAKTAMTLALRSPEMVKDLVSVDNAPVDARLESEFARYTQGMRKVDEANVAKLGQADEILRDYEKVLVAFRAANLPSHQREKTAIVPSILTHRSSFSALSHRSSAPSS
jgi:pimeloyl-ACP methyl ester carboxylesterase